MTTQCKYCKGELDFIKDGAVRCGACDVNILLNKDGSVSAYWFSCGRYYALFKAGGKFSLIKEPYNGQEIVELSYWPDNITPQNLSSKIPLLLTFS